MVRSFLAILCLLIITTLGHTQPTRNVPMLDKSNSYTLGLNTFPSNGSTAAGIRLTPGGATGAPSSGAHLAGELHVASDGKLYICTAGGSPGTWAEVGTGAGGGTGIAGGGETIYYAYSTTTTDSDPGAGNLRFNDASLDLATKIFVDLTDANSVDVTTMLGTFDDSTSTVKGYVRVSSTTDSTKYIVFPVTSVTTATGYRKINLGTVVAYSSTTPFANTDPVILTYTRNGDLGEQGIPGGPIAMLYRFSTSTVDSDPGTSYIRLDNTTYSSVNQAYISIYDQGGNNLTTLIDSFDDSTSTIKGQFKISSRSNAAQYIIYTISSLTTATGYRKLGLTYVASGGSAFSNADLLSLSFQAVGDKGDTGATGPTGGTGPQGNPGADAPTITFKDGGTTLSTSINTIIAQPDQFIITTGGTGIINMAIATNGVTSDMILDGAVGSGKIADGAITSAKILDGTIASGDIAPSGVANANILDGTIASGKIADGAITSAKILDGTIASGDIAPSGVANDNILDGTIASGKIADGAITSAKILDGTIMNTDISATAAITHSKLADLSSTSALIGASGGSAVPSTITLGTGLQNTGTTLRVKDATEACILLADNTTLDVSTSMHGLVPKAPNDTSKYLRGDGTWATPAGGGGSGSLSGIEVGTAYVTGPTTITFLPTIDWSPPTLTGTTANVTYIGIPPGSVIPFAGKNTPTGWLLCDGSNKSRTTYAALFSAIGTVYGNGDGSTTFGVPDMRGRVATGKDDMGGSQQSRITAGGCGVSGTVLGSVGGAETITLTIGEIPAHTHTVSVVGATSYCTAAAGANSWKGTGNQELSSKPAVSANAPAYNADSRGGGGASKNVPPMMILNYIIKY